MVKLTFVVSVVFSLIVINNAVEIKPRIVRGYQAELGQFPFYAFLASQNPSADVNANATADANANGDADTNANANADANADANANADADANANGDADKDVNGDANGDEDADANANKTQIGSCGGTIISDRWILTAAHCIYNATDETKMAILLGGTKLDAREDSRIAMVVNKTDFIMHSQYSPGKVAHDIALIRLPQKIPFSKNIQKLALPDRCKTAENIQAITVGHGRTGDNESISMKLQYAVLKTLPSTYCRQLYPFHYPGKRIVCAFNNVDNQSVCQGDSGGPLISRNGNHIIGVTAFVSGSCERGYPQGFVNIYPYLEWIGKHTGMKLPKC